MTNTLPAALVTAIAQQIDAEAVARFAANAAEPYVHAVYEAHEKRTYRLVAVLADGDDILADRMNNALLDLCGEPGAEKLFRLLEAERAYSIAEDAFYVRADEVGDVDTLFHESDEGRRLGDVVTDADRARWAR